ncbi:uncharacterized protein LOC113147453 [Cyclospora cayetanensis]|uniref:Uncharacterized protein LOC113147453 n=1 Tax=Cyclospora cayetanensis TaxID=88456 RepID=A0A6P6S2H9_9EIME|nr:uncharacterized protein LOC113147453 [Cyclospora cayetanensis]
MGSFSARSQVGASPLGSSEGPRSEASTDSPSSASRGDTRPQSELEGPSFCDTRSSSPENLVRGHVPPAAQTTTQAAEDGISTAEPAEDAEIAIPEESAERAPRISEESGITTAELTAEGTTGFRCDDLSLQGDAPCGHEVLVEMHLKPSLGEGPPPSSVPSTGSITEKTVSRPSPPPLMASALSGGIPMRSASSVRRKTDNAETAGRPWCRYTWTFAQHFRDPQLLPLHAAAFAAARQRWEALRTRAGSPPTHTERLDDQNGEQLAQRQQPHQQEQRETEDSGGIVQVSLRVAGNTAVYVYPGARSPPLAGIPDSLYYALDPPLGPPGGPRP